MTRARTGTMAMARAKPRSFRLLAASSGVVLAVLAPASLRAQTVDYGALEKLFNEPVTTSATGSPQRATDVPADMEIITAEDIRRSGATSIPDVLQFVAGVNVRRYGYSQTDVSVRGYDQQFSPHLLVLINGRQVYLDDYGRTSWESLPVQLDEIRQIEIVKGPNSALFGFNAVGGVVNIITYDPLLDSASAVTARAGTQAYASGSAVVSLHDGDVAGLRLSAGGFKANEFSTDALPQVLGPYDHSPHQYALSGDGRLKLADHVVLSAEVTTTDAKSFEVLPAPLFVDDSYRTNSFKLGLAADTRFGLLDLTAYRNELTFGVRYPGFGSVAYNDSYVVQASDLFKLDTAQTFRLSLEFRDNALWGSPFRGRVGYDVYAASATWNWQVPDGISFTNAVRFDYLTLGYSGSLVPDIKFSYADYNSATIAEPSFNSGLVYKPTDEDTLRLLAARGVQAPSLIDFGLQSSLSAGGAQFSDVGSPALHASSIMNYELDYDRALAAIGADLRSAVYYKKTSNLFVSPLNAPSQPGAGGDVSYSQNIGDSDAIGAEIGLKGVTDWGLRWSGSYAFISIADHYTIGLLSSATSVLDYAHGSPSSVFDAGLGYDWGRFEIDTEARWQSHYFDYQSVDAVGGVSPVLISDYLTLDARLGYRVTQDLTAALIADQMLHSQIIEAAGTPVERQVMATITAKF